MKTFLALVFILAAGVSPLRAQQAGDVGAGLVLGDPTGVTAKFWLDGSRALDTGIGLGDNVTLYGDYLWHSWKVLPQPSQGKLPVYLGLGAQLRTGAPGELGLRAVAGIAYWLPRDPLEIFLEIVPVIRFSHDGSEVTAGAGLRYYFKWS